MMFGKAVGVTSTLTAGGTIAAATQNTVSVVSPEIYNLLGVQVPILPVAVGVLTALLVRVVVMTSDPGKLWSYNAAVTLLAMLGAAAFITDHQTTPGAAFFVGGSFGAVGVGLVTLMKSTLFGSIIDGIRVGMRKGLDDKPSD